MPIGKSIRVYLADATVSGIRYAELVNWTGHALACPRTRLAELATWPEASKPGIYFLFESRLGESKSLAYIGESENVSGRLTSHDRNKDFWNEVVIFTSKDENLTKAHIKFLESTLVALAKGADRFELENGNTPPESSLPRADRDAMAEFVENIRMVLGILGYPILEPLLKSLSPPHRSAQADSMQSSMSPLSELIFRVNALTAYGAVTDEGFVIKKGSQFSKTNSESIAGKLAAAKKRYADEGVLISKADHFVSTEDILMGSSSYAAGIVAGTSRSGPQSWKTSAGKTLKEVEDASMAIA